MALLGFPHPVDEVSARLVATGVVLLGAAALVFGAEWLLLPMALGFWARVLTGPKLSPLGRLVTQVVRPRVPVRPRYVPGPPKRFAQGIGATLTTAGAVLHLGFGATGAAQVLLVLLVVAASLEAFAGFCLGCAIFGRLMRAGVIPESVCETCALPDRDPQPERRADARR
jgi:hypothetical protein